MRSVRQVSIIAEGEKYDKRLPKRLLVMLYTDLKENMDFFRCLIKRGVVDAHWIRDIKIYEAYNYINNGCKMCAYELLAEKFKISSDTIRKIIAQMSN